MCSHLECPRKRRRRPELRKSVAPARQEWSVDNTRVELVDDGEARSALFIDDASALVNVHV